MHRPTSITSAYRLHIYLTPSSNRPKLLSTPQTIYNPAIWTLITCLAGVRRLFSSTLYDLQRQATSGLSNVVNLSAVDTCIKHGVTHLQKPTVRVTSRWIIFFLCAIRGGIGMLSNLNSQFERKNLLVSEPDAITSEYVPRCLDE